MKYSFNTDRRKKCPRCNATRKIRITRKWWMRLIPPSKYFRCGKCDHCFLYIGKIGFK